MIKEEIDGNVLSSISQKAGVSEDQAEKGFSVAIPAVLAGIQKNNNGENSGLLGGLFVQGAGDEQIEEDDSQLLNRGSAMANNLFGTEREKLTTEVANATGLDHHKSSGLLAMIVPTITGLISKLMTKHNWNLTDVLGRVASTKDDIATSLSDIPPTGFPKTDTPPNERLEPEERPIEVPPAPIPPVVDEPVIDEPVSDEPIIGDSVREEDIIDETIESEPVIDEASVTNEPLRTVDDTEDIPLSREPVTPESIARETVEQERIESEQIPPRAAIPPEPSPKSGGGMLRWLLIIVLVILILWWLL